MVTIVTQKVAMPDEAADKFSKYNLFAYAEGRLIERARNMVFNGAPVLFVPGNAGSYKQVRTHVICENHSFYKYIPNPLGALFGFCCLAKGN